MKLLKWAAEEYNVQVFATTHSLEAVDAVLKALEHDPEALVAYQLNKTQEGTRVKRMPEDLLNRVRLQRGLDIR